MQDERLALFSHRPCSYGHISYLVCLFSLFINTFAILPVEADNACVKDIL